MAGKCTMSATTSHMSWRVWRQAGLSSDESGESRKIVSAAGLTYVDEVEIADAARSAGSSQ